MPTQIGGITRKHIHDDNTPGGDVAGSKLERSRHVCAFFNNKEEEYKVLLPFIVEGFHQGDKALLSNGTAYPLRWA
jgi:hypothetical protein